MKQRFSSLDVKVVASELSQVLCSLRLANIYDLSSRILLFKFAKPDRREQILVDPGFRCHLTSFSRATAAAPSHFVTKLRKYLRSRRLTAVAQVGTDRVLELQFSDGQYRLFIEFYAAGNIILADSELNILSVLRLVSKGAEQEELRVGLKYALENRQNHSRTPESTKDRVRAALQTALDRADQDGTAQPNKKRKSGDLLRKALTASIGEFPPMLIDHALRAAAFESAKPIVEVLNDENLVNDLVAALRDAQQLVERIADDKSPKGYIFAKAKSNQGSSHAVDDINDTSQEPGSHDNTVYVDFQPFKPLQLTTPEWTIFEFDGFNKAVDEFFSSIEGQKLESRLAEREQNAKRKLDNARQDHAKRIGGLQQVQELNVRKAQAIEANLQRVQEAIGAVNGLIGQGMDWVEIARLIEMEQARHNPVAEMIKLPLKLYENTVTLRLAEEAFEDDIDNATDLTDDSASESEDNADRPSRRTEDKVQESADKWLAVEINLALSPWSNARQYYDQKKTAASKEQKTLQSSTKALKNTERKVNADLKKGLKQEKQTLRPVRKQLWFEKFLFFISSEGYLVLGGKDAQQNEILYKRYLKKGDIYVHADLQGATSVIVKNKPGRSADQIPPSTLSQAGSFAVATSYAWDSKAVMSAWWVHPAQVSKSAPTCDYLSVGSFNIQGEKNFLPPAHLLLGFGVLFQVNEESLARRRKHRHEDERLITNRKDDEDESADFDAMGDKTTTRNQKTAVNEIIHNDTEGVADQTADEMEVASQPDSENVEDAETAEHHGSDSEVHNPLLSRHPVVHVTTRSQYSESHGWQFGMEQDQPATDVQDAAEGSSDDAALYHMPEEALSPATIARDASSVRHLSTKERGLLQTDRGPVAAAEAQVTSVAASTEEILAQSATASGATPNNPHVRGKHGKRNKLKTKYADQDEEDRVLALRLLGSAATQKVTEDATTKAAEEEQAALQKQRRRQQHLTAARKGMEEEEARKAALEEGLESVDLNEAKALETLEAYVGTPHPGDEILDALVVCGPWDAIGKRCRWRAKIQPGSTKKGKAVREILTTWTKTIANHEKKKRPRAGEGNEVAVEEEEIRRREGQLIQGIKEVEVIGVIPVGKVRVVMGAAESSGRGKGGGGAAKRGGRGSKKQR
ncbi:MAG: hypothetical protein Q9209_006549 [Squamulea sp. 1 TL-2023]